MIHRSRTSGSAPQVWPFGAAQCHQDPSSRALEPDGPLSWSQHMVFSYQNRGQMGYRSRIKSPQNPKESRTFALELLQNSRHPFVHPFDRPDWGEGRPKRWPPLEHTVHLIEPKHDTWDCPRTAFKTARGGAGPTVEGHNKHRNPFQNTTHGTAISMPIRPGWCQVQSDAHVTTTSHEPTWMAPVG